MDRVGKDLEKLDLPPGYRFVPSNSELILGYLKNKILGKELPTYIIPTIDAYSCNPDMLPLSDFRYGKLNEWYFFSHTINGEIVTDNGYYVVSYNIPIFDGSIGDIGHIRTLEFYHGKPPGGTKSQWSIQEFNINPDLIKVNNDDQSQTPLISSLPRLAQDRPIETATQLESLTVKRIRTNLVVCKIICNPRL